MPLCHASSAQFGPTHDIQIQTSACSRSENLEGAQRNKIPFEQKCLHSDNTKIWGVEHAPIPGLPNSDGPVDQWTVRQTIDIIT